MTNTSSKSSKIDKQAAREGRAIDKMNKYRIKRPHRKPKVKRTVQMRGK